MKTALGKSPVIRWLAAFVAGPALAYGAARCLSGRRSLDPPDETPIAAQGLPPRPASASGSRLEKPRATGFLAEVERLKRPEEMAAETILARLRSGEAPDAEVPGLFAGWCANDAIGAWQWWIAEGRRLYGNHDLTGPAAAALFQRDPAAAIATVRGLVGQPDGDLPRVSVSRAVHGIVALLTGRDEAAAARVGPYLDELAALSHAGLPFDDGEITAQNVSTVARRIAALPAGGIRDLLLVLVGRFPLGGDPNDSMKWIESLSSTDRQKVEQGAIDRICRAFPGQDNDPKVAWAAARLSAPEAGALRARFGADVARHLAATDPVAAWEFARQNLPAEPLARAAGCIVTQVWDTDRGQALQMLESLAPGSVREMAAGTLASHWTWTGSGAEAAAWAHEQKLGAVGERTWREIGDAWAQKSPIGLMEAVRKDAAVLPFHALQAAMPTLMARAPEQTLAWAREIQPSMKYDIYGHALERLAESDPRRAIGLLDQPDARPTSAGHAETIIRHFLRNDPAGARAWAAHLPDGPLKAQATGIVGPHEP